MLDIVGGDIETFNDLANHISSVVVVWLFLKALPPMVEALLNTLSEMKNRDLERIKLLSDMWERTYQTMYDDRGDCND